MLRIGYHVSISGSLDMAFDRARSIGCTAMQMFVSNPRSWSSKQFDDKEAESFRAKETGYDIRPVFAHMPYLPNPASPKEAVYEKTIASLLDTVSRCERLRVGYLILHLGSHLGEGKEKGFQKVTEAVTKAADAAKSTHILMENEAGQRNSVGSELEDLAELYSRIGRDNVGFCIDTCHLFAAGYDIRKEEVLDDIMSTLGESRIRAIHLNDARYPLNSHLDRHQNIGFGHIGSDGFRIFLNYRGVADKPIIMETPWEHAGTGELGLVRKIIEKD